MTLDKIKEESKNVGEANDALDSAVTNEAQYTNLAPIESRKGGRTRKGSLTSIIKNDARRSSLSGRRSSCT